MNKQDLRRIVRERLSQFDLEALACMSEDLCAEVLRRVSLLGRPSTVLLYWPLPDEVDTRPLISELVYSGHTVLLPVVTGKSMVLRAFDGSFAVGELGVQEPQGPNFQDYESIDLAFIPGRAFSLEGKRLGRGKGYYDNFLPLLNCHLIGLCYPFQILPDVPCDEHDIPVHEVLHPEVLLFGTMGKIGPAAAAALAASGVFAVHVDFPQNVCRDIPGYRRELIHAIELYQPSVVMPVGNASALAMHLPELVELFPGVRFCVDKEENMRLLDSKVAVYELCQKLGVRVPQRYLSVEQIPAGQQVIFKRDVSFGGHGVHLPRTAESLLNLIAHQPEGEPYLIEDFIPGTEYSVDALRFGGQLRCSVYRSVKPSIGEELSRHSNAPALEREVLDPSMEICSRLCSAVSAVLDSLDYRGVCGFDFIVSEDGIPYLLEANPRFTGGLDAQIAAGFDIPLLLMEGWTK